MISYYRDGKFEGTIYYPGSGIWSGTWKINGNILTQCSGGICSSYYISSNPDGNLHNNCSDKCTTSKSSTSVAQGSDQHVDRASAYLPSQIYPIQQLFTFR